MLYTYLSIYNSIYLYTFNILYIRYICISIQVKCEWVKIDFLSTYGFSVFTGIYILYTIYNIGKDILLDE